MASLRRFTSAFCQSATKKLSNKVSKDVKSAEPPSQKRSSGLSPVPSPPRTKSRFRNERDPSTQRVVAMRMRPESARSTRAAPLVKRTNSRRCIGRLTRYEYQPIATPAARKLTEVRKDARNRCLSASHTNSQRYRMPPSQGRRSRRKAKRQPRNLATRASYLHSKTR